MILRDFENDFLGFNCVEYCVFLAKQYIMNKLLSLTESLPVEDDPQHNRCTDEGRDRVDRQVAFKRGQAGDEVAE